MKLRVASASALVLALTMRCSSSPPPPPPPCDPITSVSIPGFDDGDVVWGFADLHAHPAIEVAFHGNLVWGTALDDAPVDGSELPAIAACPVETHNAGATSPLDRAVGGKVFPPLSSLGGFAHAPVGSVGYRASAAWPNARDVIHQGMNVSSIRRAYEGGLRLMFASTTDNQAVAALLRGPNAANGFVPDPNADYESARAQLELIEKMVARNASWMAIASTPEEARDIIHHGKLALVMSLEMDGLREEQFDRLYDEHAVRHIVPIHLIDNDVGGTAANGDLFNAASAAASAIYRDDGASFRYMDLVATPDRARTVGWPVRIGTLDPPFYANLDPVDYSSYATLCYEDLAACSGVVPQAASFVELGQRNLRGLCRSKSECAAQEHPYGADRIRHIKSKKGMFIDVSHMSWKSVQDTLAIDQSYPWMASHGDVVELCDGIPGCVETQPAPMTERSLDGHSARIVASRGVIGLGTSVSNYQARDALAARGGPLFTVSEGQRSACVQNGAACAPIVSPELAPVEAPLDTLVVETHGGVDAPVSYAQPFVRVVMRANVADWQHQRRVFVQPLVCSAQGCSATIALGNRDELVPNVPLDGVPYSACAPPTCGGSYACGTTQYTVDDVESVTLEWQYLACDSSCRASTGDSVVPRQCQSTWDDDKAPYWTIERAAVRASLGTDVAFTLAELSRPDGTPVARLGRNRGSLVAYARDDRHDTRTAKAVPASGQLLKISLRASPGSDLAGASPAEGGGNVCVAVRQLAAGVCMPATPPSADATDCPPGWVSLNQRGEWSENITLWTFARADASAVCGLDVAVLDWPNQGPPFSVDEARVEAIEDPVEHWIHRYAEVSRWAAGAHLGTLAFGTDFNGLNGVMDISEQPLPDGAQLASACSVTTGAGPSPPGTLAPMRIRNADGSLGAQVRIDERGLATYGMLADMVAIIKASQEPCATDVYDSLMLSAEATIRAWERILGNDRGPLPVAPNGFVCTGAP